MVPKKKPALEIQMYSSPNPKLPTRKFRYFQENLGLAFEKVSTVGCQFNQGCISKQFIWAGQMYTTGKYHQIPFVPVNYEQILSCHFNTEAHHHIDQIIHLATS